MKTFEDCMADIIADYRKARTAAAVAWVTVAVSWTASAALMTWVASL